MPKRKRGQLPRMILDRELCLRVADGDEDFALPTTAYHCPVCCERPETFSGKVRYGNKATPECEDHDPPIAMEGAPR